MLLNDIVHPLPSRDWYISLLWWASDGATALVCSIQHVYVTDFYPTKPTWQSQFARPECIVNHGSEFYKLGTFWSRGRGRTPNQHLVMQFHLLITADLRDLWHKTYVLSFFSRNEAEIYGNRLLDMDWGAQSVSKAVAILSLAEWVHLHRMDYLNRWNSVNLSYIALIQKNHKANRFILSGIVNLAHNALSGYEILVGQLEWMLKVTANRGVHNFFHLRQTDKQRINSFFLPFPPDLND